MKKSDIIYQVACSSLTLTVFEDFRVRAHGRGRNQWTFPYASLSLALRHVEIEQKAKPHAKWQITVDKTA